MDDVVIVAPDAGRVKTAERFAQFLGADLAFAHKRRPRGTMNTVETDEIIGDVAGKHCIIIDDMIDTAGTVCAASDLLMRKGATDVWIMATHAVSVGPGHRESAEIRRFDEWLLRTRCPSRPKR